VIDHQSGLLGTGGDGLEITQRFGECVGDRDGLVHPWDPLVEVAGDHDATASRRLRDLHLELLAERPVVFPRLPVPPPGSNVAVLPGDADREDRDR
jgi:hypothetical protein